ncbi:MAG: prepilin-type N-terminal cleavage/methylation domain-containing protein [Oligoflexia bacterium]|nr:prepilin-type N-terminal cleavage/methylation domain-containing protein [Oligoflexia bacterium]
MRNGFSLVELLVVLAIGGIATFALLSQNVFQARNARSSAQNQALGELVSTLQSGLRGTACRTALRNPGNQPVKFDTTGASETSIDNITVGPAVLAKVGTEKDRLRIRSLKLKVTADVDSPPQGQRLLGSLLVEVSKMTAPGETAAVGGSELQPRAITLNLVAANPGSVNSAIADCSTGSLLKEALAQIGSCGSGAYLAGFDPNGNKICAPLPSGQGTQTQTQTAVPLVSAVNQALSGSGSMVFPVYNSSGSCNRMPVVCSGAFSVNTVGSNFSSSCASGWTSSANCENSAGQPIPGCPMNAHPSTGTPCN